MLRFVLLTCWLIGAGGGWGLGLAGLNAMGSGAGSYAELIMLGGASSWAAMLITALRPGRRPNLWQRVFTVLAWLMPVGMFMLGDTFNLNVRLFSLLAAACVTMIVVIYPSQSPQPRLDEGRRLALHVRKQEAEQKVEQMRRGEGAPDDAAPAQTKEQLHDQAVSAAWTSSPEAPVAQRASPTSRPVPEPPRDGWAPRAPVRPAASQTASSVEEGSRWQSPRVPRRGKLRNDRAGGSRGSGGRER